MTQKKSPVTALFSLSGLFTLLACLPVLALLWTALQGNSEIWEHLLQYVIPPTLIETGLLLLGVGILTILIGTGSAWLVSGDGQRVLLTHHRKLDRWLQLGGHADGDADLAAVALREAEEESGLRGLSLESPAIFDLDRHWIPARGEVAGHWHYDVRYVVRAGADERFKVSAESLALAWRPVAGIHADPAADGSLRRMAGKWLAGRA